MKKIVNIAWKDLVITFRDPGALILMLVTPFALTLGMAFAFGGFSDDSAGTGLENIPVVIVDQDNGQIGQALVDLFQSQDLEDLVEPSIISGEEEARLRVDDDQAAAAVIIPEDLTERVIPSGPQDESFSSQEEGEQAVIEVYGNPTRPISAGVIRGIVREFVNHVTAGLAGIQVSMAQMIIHDVISGNQASQVGEALGERVIQRTMETEPVSVESESGPAQEEASFNVMAYMAPSMAIFFLMFTVTAGGRTILAEREEGTLTRMLTTPTSAAQVLGGKIFGTYLTGVVQMVILIAASSLLFDMGWGSPLPVVVLVLVLVAAATGWGMLLAAYARTPGQASTMGTALSLGFGIAAGHFFPRDIMPLFVQRVSYVSPNAWGLEAFQELGAGGGLADISSALLALGVMAVVVFSAAVVFFRRGYA